MLIVAGVDEAGRGPLAGPVVAAAVILNPKKRILGLKDSKKLTAAQREELADLIRKKVLCYAIASASVEEIDEINILQASLLAMTRAVNALSIQPEHVYIDGNICPRDLLIPATAIIGGDDSEPCISAASILAKVERDKLMLDWHSVYPQYGFANHKGYGTKMHLTALAAHGITPIHRRSFAPVKELIDVA